MTISRTTRPSRTGSAEGEVTRDTLGVDPRRGVVTLDLRWTKPRRRPYRKTGVRRPPHAVRR